MEEIALNGPLVSQVQGILTELPLAQRVYNGIINSTAATALPKWRITEEGVNLDMAWQVVDVKKPLASIGRMCGAGNVAIFIDEGGYIVAKKTGLKKS